MLVVVASRAGDAQAHHARADDVDLVVNYIHRKVIIHRSSGLRSYC